ncbi:serine/threonine-protein kinase [Catenulispora rubra]|uniref:serine/threonine-protein kinase n=1 Tax=Catenulispora rubra TaxID=280293 RepID=UPI0018924DED|nr:serine/threonine-protein kinase [Catenulispora rubra]
MEQLTADDPRWIGQYRLLRRLGAGGMGLVYLGRTAGGRTVAVKRVHADYANDQEFRQRFRQEVAAARRVGGRWTAPVFDADTEGPQPWVATGYVAGPSLQAAVKEFGPLPPATVRALGAGLAEALDAVHKLGLVHRDVKPSNVLLALDGPRLIDFGITRALDAAVQLTRTGLLVGSPGYLSPEQAQGTAAGPASDVFSLGAVLAFAAVGASPFGEKLPVATLLYRVLHEDPDLSRLAPDLRPLVAACMAKNPAARPTLDQLRIGLEAGGDRMRLGGEGWLPPAISASVGRLAVELLDLDSDLDSDPSADAAQADPSAQAPTPTLHPQQAAANDSLRMAEANQLPPQGFLAPGYQGQPAFTQPSFTPPPTEAPLTAVATMTGSALPAWRNPPPPSPKRRGPLIAAIGAGAVVVVAAIAIAVSQSSSSDTSSQRQGGGSTPTSNAQAGKQSSTGSTGGAIPSSYLGTWQGTVTGSQLPYPLPMTVTVAQGRMGDPVGTVANDGGNGQTCTIKTSLVSASASRMVLRYVPGTASSGCIPILADEIYTLNQNGSMQMTVGGYLAELNRQ